MEKASCDGSRGPDRQQMAGLLRGAVVAAKKLGAKHIDISFAEAHDLLILLREEKTHLLCPDDFDNNPLVDENGVLPAWVEYRRFNGVATPVDGWTTITRNWVDGYRNRRFWTGQPTEEQRKETTWDE